MAYLTTLASVSQGDVEKLAQKASHILTPSCKEYVSHYLAYHLGDTELGIALDELVDGGEIINKGLWHPLRPPIYHSATSVPKLFATIVSAYTAVQAQDSKDEWLTMEIGRVIRVLKHAPLPVKPL